MRVHQPALLLTLALSSILLSSCATIPSGGASPIVAEYVNTRAQRAQAWEHKGDSAVARGDLQQAADDYTRAVSDAATDTQGHWGVHAGRVAGAHTRVVTKIAPGSIADQAGLKVGDKITPIDPGLAPKYMNYKHGVIAWILDNPLRPAVLLVQRGKEPAFKVRIHRPVILLEGYIRAQQKVARSSFRKLVAVYARMNRFPAIPEEARKLAKQAQADAQNATTAEAVSKVSDEYRLATYFAPWWTDLHFNYAMFQANYDDPIGAIRSFNYYLMLRPNAQDAAAVRAKIASLKGPAVRERQLAAWEGQWYLMLNGTKQTYGMWIHRKGNELFVRYRGKVPYLRATIITPHVAKAENRFADDAGSIPSAMESAVQRCFGGVAEIPGTLTLSPDDRQLTLSMSHDFNFNITTCRFVSRAPSSLVYVR